MPNTHGQHRTGCKLMNILWQAGYAFSGLGSSGVAHVGNVLRSHLTAFRLARQTKDLWAPRSLLHFKYKKVINLLK